MTEIEILNEKLEAYQYVESFFGLDKDDNIIFDEDKDRIFELNNIADNKSYSNFDSFVKYIDGKSKKELLDKLNKLNKFKSGNYNIVPSEEQNLIFKTISKQKCIFVDAVAGSGKTTTMLVKQ